MEKCPLMVTLVVYSTKMTTGRKAKQSEKKSALRKHAKEHHNDKKVEYRMEIVKSFKNNPLARQVFESVKIVKSKLEDDIQLNNKDEFNQALIITTKYTRGVHC